jgi:carbon-monoxide dehydrogenase medium subunit
MYPATFDYYRATSLPDALRLLGAHSGAKVLAGGHSLVPMMKLRLAMPSAVVDIGRIPELKGIRRDGDTIRIGALTTHAELESSELLRSQCPLVAEAAATIADPQVRNRGTIGGNLAHADPASDLPAVVLALDGAITLAGASGERRVDAKPFFVDLLTTDIRAGEIVTRIDVGVIGPRAGSAYLKFEHPASGYAVCAAAAVVHLGSDGRCRAARLCLNGVTATPLDAAGVSAALVGSTLDDGAIDAAVAGKLAVRDPLGDALFSGDYRASLARTFARRALKLARDRARSRG